MEIRAQEVLDAEAGRHLLHGQLASFLSSGCRPMAQSNGRVNEHGVARMLKSEQASTTPPQARTHSAYVVYVDESGDHNLESIDPEYPVFVLSFCVFRKADYVYKAAPAIRNLKFQTFGHDMVVLHETDSRRKRGAFAQLSKEPREAFLEALTDIIRQSDFQLVAVVIDKLKLKARLAAPCQTQHLGLACT